MTVEFITMCMIINLMEEFFLYSHLTKILISLQFFGVVTPQKNFTQQLKFLAMHCQFAVVTYQLVHVLHTSI